MSKNQHRSNPGETSANQNNQMSEDPGDGNRTSFTTGKDGETPVEAPPEHDSHDQATIEEFGDEGMGIAPKE